MNKTHSIYKCLPSYLRWGMFSIVVALVTLMLTQGCSSTPLQPWHTIILDEEFTVSKADEIQTFDDYLKLEERLFNQLETDINAVIETGPEYALIRYSPGSLSDPQGRQPNWNRSFELPTDQPVGGVILLHGMSDSPYSSRALGETLNKQGYWVIGLRLPGHGTAPSGLRYLHWRDMSAAVLIAVEHLKTKIQGRSVHMIGYSTGAPLALDFTLNALNGEVSPVPASLVLISPAIGLHPAAALAKWKRRMSILPGLGGLAWLSIQPEFDPYKYNSFTTNAAEQVHSLASSVSGRISNWARRNPNGEFPPILVFKSTVDATVSNNAVVDRLLGVLPPHKHEFVLFDINRLAAKSTILVADPGPFTTRLMNDDDLPFTLTLLTNETPDSNRIVSQTKAPYSADITSTKNLDLTWPKTVISLSHVALPIPPDDPLYGQRSPENSDLLFLGQMAIYGERGLLKLPSDWMLRLRHNPFYSYLENRTVEWLGQAGPGER